MPRDILRLQWNQPCVVKIDQGPEGVPRQGRFGLDYEYRCNSDTALLWLPPEGREALLRAGAQAGEEVSITKSKRGRELVFFVGRASDAAEPPAPSQAIAPRPANGHLHRPAQPATRNQAAPQPAPFPPVALQLAACLCAAIDAASEAQSYAQSKSLPVEFAAEDIRALALSAFISAQRSGGA